jgi:Ubiquitin-conjugating enzyme
MTKEQHKQTETKNSIFKAWGVKELLFLFHHQSLLFCLDNYIGNCFVKKKQVESIVLSIISMLSSPNDESPANIEAAVS